MFPKEKKMCNDLNVWSSLSSGLPVVYFVTLLREVVCSYRQWNTHCCLAPRRGGGGWGWGFAPGPESPDGVAGGDRWRRLMGVSTCHSSVPGQDDGWWVGSHSTPRLRCPWPRGQGRGRPVAARRGRDGGWRLTGCGPLTSCVCPGPALPSASSPLAWAEGLV